MISGSIIKDGIYYKQWVRNPCKDQIAQ
jgi:hypothetical protein